tara:strand:+ start:157 stop:510 length:354 start_codon:yes stop_codon:yes gene_type:complete
MNRNLIISCYRDILKNARKHGWKQSSGINITNNFKGKISESYTWETSSGYIVETHGIIPPFTKKNDLHTLCYTVKHSIYTRKPKSTNLDALVTVVKELNDLEKYEYPFNELIYRNVM